MHAKRFLGFSIFSALMLMAGAPWAQDVVFKNHGKVVKTLSISDMEKTIVSRKITVFEPHEEVNREYVGFSTNELLDAVYGNDWRKAEEILFTCVDSYQPSIPSAKFQKYESFLVFKHADQSAFSLHTKVQNNDFVQLGPTYLIWDNLQHSELLPEGADDWPYQVTALDLISFAERFPKLAPPAGSSASVTRGFLAFRRYCMTCHSMNGEGGKKSINLNMPNVTGFRDASWLKQWIADPTSINPATLMPALNKKIANRDVLINDLIGYLKAMAKPL